MGTRLTRLSNVRKTKPKTKNETRKEGRNEEVSTEPVRLVPTGAHNEVESAPWYQQCIATKLMSYNYCDLAGT